MYAARGEDFNQRLFKEALKDLGLEPRHTHKVYKTLDNWRLATKACKEGGGQDPNASFSSNGTGSTLSGIYMAAEEQQGDYRFQEELQGDLLSHYHGQHIVKAMLPRQAARHALPTAAPPTAAPAPAHPLAHRARAPRPASQAPHALAAFANAEAAYATQAAAARHADFKALHAGSKTTGFGTLEKSSCLPQTQTQTQTHTQEEEWAIAHAARTLRGLSDDEESVCWGQDQRDRDDAEGDAEADAEARQRATE
jgi:hypothetical protein